MPKSFRESARQQIKGADVKQTFRPFKTASEKKSQEKITGKSPVKKSCEKSQEKVTGKSPVIHYKPEQARRSYRFEVNVTPDTGAAIKTAAQALKISANEFINQAIIKHLKRGK